MHIHQNITYTQELAYLNFFDSVNRLSQTLKSYSTFAGISLIIFVFKLLKGLDFQVSRLQPSLALMLYRY